MSDGLNRVMLLGFLGAKPELRYTQAGTPVLGLRLATNESYVDRNKERQDRTEWHNVTLFGARAEGLAPHLDKGTKLFIEGSLRTSKYEKDGVERWKTEIVANNVVFAGGRNEHGGGDGDEGGSRPQTRQPQQAQRGGSSGGGGQRQAAPSGGSAGGGETAGDYMVTFGRNKDKRISEIENASDLSWLRDKLVAELADDSKSKYHDKSRKQLASIDAELARRGGGGGGRPAGGHQRAQRSAPVEDPTYGEGGGNANFDDGFGRGYGEDGDIPFASCSFAADPMLSYLRPFRV
jgi:single-strand DNA-binding protein